MAHFAQLDSNNNVINVVVVSNDDCEGGELAQEIYGQRFLRKLFGEDTVWKQTSYNNNFRGNLAGIGMTYMSGVKTLGVASTDIFVDQQPFPSWEVGITTARWFSPYGDNGQIKNSGLSTTQITAGSFYNWDESAYQADTGDPKTAGWVLDTIPSYGG